MVSNIQDVSTSYISPTTDVTKKTALVPSVSATTDTDGEDASLQATTDPNAVNQRTDDAGSKEKTNENSTEIKKKLTKKDVNTMTSALNDFMKNLNCDLEFKYYDKLNQLTVKMVDSRTHETIKEFPPEEIMKAMIKTKEWIGVFLDKNV
jgi:flagellar protein FlaG